ncbi:MAG: hypothetical protein ACREUG_11670 [Steroidobacteraceae bacterium]
MRAAIALLAQRNVLKLEGWLDRTARTDPAKAAEILLRALEYHIPKLGRMEHSGPGGGPIPIARHELTDEQLLAIAAGYGASAL